MAVYRDLRVEIPKEHVVIERQRAGPALIKYVLEYHYDSRRGYPVAKRTIIGHQCIDSATCMHPTSQYREVFPTRWEELTKERVKASVKKIGLFSACQAINSVCGIKDILDESYGEDRSSAIMDYAMDSIIFHTNEASGFAIRMKDQLTYVETPRSDTYYSRLFETNMSRRDELIFKRKWALQCKEEGVEEVWLCIDGSNEDCHSKGVEIAEKGHAKSGKNVNIVSFTYAVSVNGLPVTYDVYRGGLVDAKAMKNITDFLSECGIKVRGVILDRGYCDAKAIRYLIENEIEYIIMIKGNPEGYTKVVEEFGNKIKVQAEYLIRGTTLFGVQRPIQLFKGFKHDDYVTLFFDHKNGGDRIDTVIRKMYAEIERLEKGIQSGKDVSVCNEFREILSISDGSEKTVDINAPALQAVFDSKGLYGIVTSTPMPPEEIHRKYQSRDQSEVTYRTVKTQLGYGTGRVQYTAGVRSRFAVGFVATILRYKIEQASKSQGINVNLMVQDLQLVEARKLNDVYTYSHIQNERINVFFKNFHENADNLFEESVKFMNNRINGIVPTPRHRKTGPKKGSHRKELDSEGNEVHKKRGVAKGTKRSEKNKDGTSRKKPGVKPGTKRGEFNKDGTPRKKPGPKPKSQ